MKANFFSASVIVALCASAALVDAAPMRRQDLGMDGAASAASQPAMGFPDSTANPIPTVTTNPVGMSEATQPQPGENKIKACQIQIINRTGNVTLYTQQGGYDLSSSTPLGVGQTSTYQGGDSAFATNVQATIGNLPTPNYPNGAGLGTYFVVEWKNDWMSTPWANVYFSNSADPSLPKDDSHSKMSLSEGDCVDIQVSGSPFRQLHVCRQGDSDYKVLTVEVYSA
jgi:hypothetical protein